MDRDSVDVSRSRSHVLLVSRDIFRVELRRRVLGSLLPFSDSIVHPCFCWVCCRAFFLTSTLLLLLRRSPQYSDPVSIRGNGLVYHDDLSSNSFASISFLVAIHHVTP